MVTAIEILWHKYVTVELNGYRQSLQYERFTATVCVALFNSLYSREGFNHRLVCTSKVKTFPVGLWGVFRMNPFTGTLLLSIAASISSKFNTHASDAFLMFVSLLNVLCSVTIIGWSPKTRAWLTYISWKGCMMTTAVRSHKKGRDNFDEL